MDTWYQTTKDAFQTIWITAMARWKDNVFKGHMEENPGVKTSLKDENQDRNNFIPKPLGISAIIQL